MTVRTPTRWTPKDSGTVTSDNAGVTRKLQDGTVRLEQDSTTRYLQPSVITRKVPTLWVESA